MINMVNDVDMCTTNLSRSTLHISAPQPVQRFASDRGAADLARRKMLLRINFVDELLFLV